MIKRRIILNESSRIVQLNRLTDSIRACRHCENEGLITEARPVFQLNPISSIGVFGQAPGNKAHIARTPFLDASGLRLRQWLGVTDNEFYNPDIFAILPMGFCFPGYSKEGYDRPPLKVCAEIWRRDLMELLADQLKLIFLVGSYSQNWHLPQSGGSSLSTNVSNWRKISEESAGNGGPMLLPLPHPSWRNNGWLRKNPWFEKELLPEIKSRVRSLIENADTGTS